MGFAGDRVYIITSRSGAGAEGGKISSVFDTLRPRTPRAIAIESENAEISVCFQYRGDKPGDRSAAIMVRHIVARGMPNVCR